MLRLLLALGIGLSILCVAIGRNYHCRPGALSGVTSPFDGHPGTHVGLRLVCRRLPGRHAGRAQVGSERYGCDADRLAWCCAAAKRGDEVLVYYIHYGLGVALDVRVCSAAASEQPPCYFRK